MSAMIVVLIFGIGTAFLQQELRQGPYFVKGNGRADDAAALFFLRDQSGLRENFHMMGQS